MFVSTRTHSSPSLYVSCIVITFKSQSSAWVWKPKQDTWRFSEGFSRLLNNSFCSGLFQVEENVINHFKFGSNHWCYYTSFKKVNSVFFCKNLVRSLRHFLFIYSYKTLLLYFFGAAECEQVNTELSCEQTTTSKIRICWTEYTTWLSILRKTFRTVLFKSLKISSVQSLWLNIM